MKNRLMLILVTCYVLTSSLQAQSQTKKEVFNIRAMGMDVGKITVNQEKLGNKLTVEAISEVEVRIVFKIKVKYIQTSVYENGELVTSSLKTYKKDEVNSDTRLTKNGNGYILEKDGKVTYVDDIIKYSGSLLYFNEPANITDLYFEINGEKTTVKPLGNNKYEVTDPHNGNQNEYNYNNGILDNAVIKHSLANVYLQRKSISTNLSATN
jgi:hypothetical protein